MRPLYTGARAGLRRGVWHDRRVVASPRTRGSLSFVVAMRGAVASIVASLTPATIGVGIVSLAGCRASPPAPAASPPGAIADAGAADAVDDAPIDAGPRALIDCPAGGHAVRAAWPARGVACVDAQGRRHGPAVALHPDGTIAERAAYAGGALDGPWQRFAPGGALIVDGAWRAGRRDGTWRQLAGGVELGRDVLAGGTGTLRAWHPTGALAAESSWKDGAPHGPARAWTEDGVAILDESWRDGARDGDRSAGHAAGISLRESWRGGVRHGARTLRRRGHVALDERYAQGALDGDWIAYRSPRRVRERGAYAAGARTGTWTWLDAGGAKQREGAYARGRRDGAWTEWTGPVVTWTGRYAGGVPDGAFVTYDRRGRELGRDVLAAGTGTLRTFHAGGAVETETAMVRGRAHGRFRQLTAGGRVIATGRFADGERDGAWTWRTRAATREATYARGRLDGALRRTRGTTPALAATFAAGRRSGPYAEHFADGTPAITGRFADDRRDGAWLTHRRDGSIAVRAHYRAGLLDGPWQELSPTGDVLVSGQHQRGHRVGTWTSIDAAGATTTVDHGAPDR